MNFDNLIKNVRKVEEVCYCSKHNGDTLRQIDGTLPNGKPIRIMRDRYGFHVAIGDVGLLGDFDCPPPVSAEEVEQMIHAALAS